MYVSSVLLQTSRKSLVAIPKSYPITGLKIRINKKYDVLKMSMIQNWKKRMEIKLSGHIFRH